MYTTALVILAILAAVAVGVVLAVRKQSRVTAELSAAEQSRDATVFAESSKRMEETVAEQLAAKARDPRLASMTQEDLVYEVLKDCYDPEIPLNIVDLGLVYGVDVQSDAVTIKVSMTSPQCPSHVAIREDIRVRLDDAGFPNPKVELVWEPAWSPQRISEAGRKKLGI
ncbi:MAG TPA: metal-sulfur cluster assembly factor [Terriglobia bacterium]|nr:metal-sulfur cluster assembly factor [Terriglobia bacterium]